MARGGGLAANRERRLDWDQVYNDAAAGMDVLPNVTAAISGADRLLLRGRLR